MILLAYLIWMVYVVIRAWQERRELPLLQLQLNFLGCFTLVVLTVTVSVRACVLVCLWERGE